MQRWLLIVLGSLALLSAGCGEKKPEGPDKAKMEACTKDKNALKDAASCKTCCKATGAVGHTYSKVPGRAECTCGIPEQKPKDAQKMAACAKDADAQSNGKRCKTCCAAAGATGHAWSKNTCKCE